MYKLTAYLTSAILAVLLSSCSSPPKKPVIIEDKASQKIQTPYEKYKAEFKSIQRLAQPQQNLALLSLQTRLSSYLSDNSLNYTEDYKGELKLLGDVQATILPQLLSEKDKTRYTILSAVNTFQNDKLQALKSLIPLIDQLSLAEKILAYRMQLGIINNLSSLDEIKTNLILYHLYQDYFEQNNLVYPKVLLSQKKGEESKSVLSDSQILNNFYLAKANKTELNHDALLDKYLTNIWQILSSLSINQLEQLGKQGQENTNSLNILPNNHLANIPVQIEKQLIGWKALFTLIKQTPSQYLLHQQVQLWQQQFPEHMASKEFISTQLSQHFKQFVTAKNIALLLPQSGKYAHLAQYIQHGFLAGHFQQTHQTDTLIKIYDTGKSNSIWPQYRKAVAEGADIIVGPLNKILIKDLMEENELPVITLALNDVKNDNANSASDSANSGDSVANPGDSVNNAEPVHLTTNLFQFALKPEQEIKQITAKAYGKGYTKAALLTPDSSAGNRHANAYQKAWEALGGQIVSKQVYQSKAYDYNQPITDLLNVSGSQKRHKRIRQVIGQASEFSPRIRQDIDVIFLYAIPQQAKQIPLQIDFHHGSELPIYATSRIIDEAFNEKQNKELEGIIYPDMPWLIEPNIKATSRQLNEKKANLQRFFSFGVDSYRLLPYLKLLKNKQLGSIKAETGIISIDDMGHIKRHLKFAKIKRGLPTLID